MADVEFEFGNGLLRKLTDMGDGTHAEQVIAHPPFDLMTDADGTGPNRRLRVDVEQTGFSAGRQFRMFREITDNTAFVMRATVPVNTVLFSLEAALIEGELRIETVVGGTPGGTFGTPVPTFNRNNMTDAPAYAGQVVLEEGGTHTGGTLLDILQAKTADVANFAGNVGASGDDKRGVLPGTYYFRVTIPTATCRGVISARWEEHPEGV